MCQFASFLVLKNGDVLHHPMLDSHSDLVTLFKLPDTTAHMQHFAKVELTPVDWLDASTWAFRLDEETAPGWWEDVKQSAEDRCRAIVAKMMLRSGEYSLIVDGCWIVGGTATVRDVRAGRIVRAFDSAQIRDVGGSAQIRGVWDSAQIHGVWGSAQIHDVRDSAQIHDVRDSAQIHDVWGSAQLDASAKAHVVAK